MVVTLPPLDLQEFHMALPTLTPEQRTAALAKAARARRERAEVQHRLKHGGASIADVIAAAGGHDEVDDVGDPVAALDREVEADADVDAFHSAVYFLLSLYALLTTSRGADQIRTALLDNFVHTALRGIAAR